MILENLGGIMMVKPKYQRVVLKLSGEALAEKTVLALNHQSLKKSSKKLKRSMN